VGEKQGYLDKNGKIVVEPKFDFASEFSEGLAWVLEDCESKEFTFSYIDKTGKPVSIIGRNFEFGLNFSEGLAAVFVDDKFGFIDKTGNIVIEAKFDKALVFSEGLAPAQVDDKWGYINRKGDFVIKPQFDMTFGFHKGVAMVEVGDKRGYIDNSGKYIWKPDEVVCIKIIANQALKQTGRANAAVERFNFANVFRDIRGFWSAPSGSLAFRCRRLRRRQRRVELSKAQP